MNRKQASKHLEAIKGFAEGKIIEYFNRSNKTWVKIDNPTFADGEYRVKKMPMTFYVNVYGLEDDNQWETGTKYSSKRKAITNAAVEINGKGYLKTIKMMEVEDDE